MTPDFRVFEVLQSHRIPFVIIGGHAVSFHGYVRGTEDADILWDRTATSEASLVAALVELGAEYIGNEIDPATGIERTFPVTTAFVRSKSLMMLTTRFGFLDLFDYVPGYPQVEIATLLESAIEMDGMRFVSLFWLRLLKQAAARPKDLLDLENLPNA